MGMSCNLSLRFVAFCFSTMADPLWSCLNLLTVSYSCSKFSMSHKILHIGQLLWENSWCLLVFALKAQARCLSGVWPYPSCCVWGGQSQFSHEPRGSWVCPPSSTREAWLRSEALNHAWAHTCEFQHGKWASDCVQVVSNICRGFLSSYSHCRGHFESNLFCPLIPRLAVCWSTEQQCYSACGLCMSGSP